MGQQNIGEERDRSGVKTSLNYAKLTRGLVIQKLPCPRPAGSLWHLCMASWLSACPALPCPWVVRSRPQIRSLRHHHPQPDTSSQEQQSTIPFHSSPGTLFSLASGGWAILNQPIPAKPGCLLLAWESGQDGGRISLVQRGIIIDRQNMNT